MADVLRREFYVSVQFLLLLLIALVAAFFGALPGGRGGEFVQAINLSEAWKNVAPYVESVLIIFGVLCVLRLAIIFIVHSLIRRRMG
jgi:hypothetical protein